MGQKFSLTGKHKKVFGGMIAIGLVVFILGFIMSNVSLPAHGGHEEHDSGTEHEEHNGGESHGDHHSDAGDIVKYASSENGITSEGQEGHGNAHSEDHGEEHGSMHDDSKSPEGTWIRAKMHPGQEVMVHGHKEVTGMSKIGSSLLAGTFWWIFVALFGVFFIAVGYAANAGWYIAFKRIVENFYRFLPIGGILIALIFLVFGKDIYDWYRIEVGHDELIDGKRAILNVVFYLTTAIFFVGLWSFFGHNFKKFSLAEDAAGGLENHNKSTKNAFTFLPIFALTFSFCSWIWLMSIDAHWFSTIYAVYCFAGLFVSGAMVTIMIAIHLKGQGFMNAMGFDHFHDLGKFVFAFSIFWAYIWVSQYLLIWYANIPEETIYYYSRVTNYPVLFALNVAINFFFPFIVLMTRKAKRQFDSLWFVGIILLCGRVLDMFLLIMPGAVGEEGGFGMLMMTYGAWAMIGGVFLFIVFKGFEGNPLEAKNHPYFEESIHHSTGV